MLIYPVYLNKSSPSNHSYILINYPLFHPSPSSFHTFKVSYLLLPLICFPFQKTTHGIGINNTVISPNKLVAPPIPSLPYICNVKSGNAAPNRYLKNPFAANALAAVVLIYVSTKYEADAMKILRLPHANGIAETTGEAQDMEERAVHANQKSPMGRPKEPRMAG